jgi:hypothetical protein
MKINRCKVGRKIIYIDAILAGQELVRLTALDRVTLLLCASSGGKLSRRLVQAIHVFLCCSTASRGWPGQARP